MSTSFIARSTRRLGEILWRLVPKQWVYASRTDKPIVVEVVRYWNCAESYDVIWWSIGPLRKRLKARLTDGSILTINRRAPLRPGDGDRAKALAESVECRALIKRHEGFRRGVYIDTRGNPTAGWGHLLTSRDPHHESEQWQNMDYLDELFEEDYHAALAAVSSLSTTYQALDLRAQYVLMDMAFNLGHYRLKPI